jgi:alpha/beta superfamily hydrolase
MTMATTTKRTRAPRPAPSFDLRVGRRRLEVALDESVAPRAAAVVLHGGGGTLDDAIVSRIARALVDQGAAVLRINFRGVGRSTGRFYVDEGAGERRDALAALDFISARHPELPLWLAGVSFGAWVGFDVAARDPRVQRLLGIALPLRITRFDLSALERKRQKPLAVVQGSRDEYAPPAELRRFVGALPDPKRLWIVDGAPHGFEGKLSALEAHLAKAVRWLARTADSRGRGGREGRHAHHKRRPEYWSRRR